jgi:hypothetical protein
MNIDRRHLALPVMAVGLLAAMPSTFALTADGKKSDTGLAVLMNWQKQGGTWKLLSRASAKV